MTTHYLSKTINKVQKSVENQREYSNYSNIKEPQSRCILNDPDSPY